MPSFPKFLLSADPAFTGSGEPESDEGPTTGDTGTSGTGQPAATVTPQASSPTTTGSASPTPAAAPMQQAKPPSATTIPTIEHTQTSDSFIVDDPKARKEADAARGKVEESIMSGAELGAQKAAAAQAERATTAQMLATENQRAATQEAALQNRLADAEREQREAVDQLSKMHKDPGGLWKEQGDASAFVAGIAIAFNDIGNFLMKNPGGRNRTADMIYGAIQRNLDKQDADIAIARDRVSSKTNMISQIMQRGQDQRVARSIVRQGLLEQAASRLESKMAVTPEEQRQNGAQLIAKIRADAANEQRDRSKHTITAMKEKKPAFSAVDLAKMSEDERERFVPDAGGLAASKEDASKMKGFAAAHNTVVGDIESLKHLVDEHGNESFGTAKTKMLQLYRRITTEMNKEAGLGAMSGSDRELIQDQIADPTAFFARGAKTSELLGNLLQSFANAKIHTYQAYGLVKQ